MFRNRHHYKTDYNVLYATTACFHCAGFFFYLSKCGKGGQGIFNMRNDFQCGLFARRQNMQWRTCKLVDLKENSSPYLKRASIPPEILHDTASILSLEYSAAFSWGFTFTATSYGWLGTEGSVCVGGGDGYLHPTTYSLHCHHQTDSALRRAASCVRQFDVSFILWAKSQGRVHKPQFLKRKQSRSESNRGPSAYQPHALPLGHTSSLLQFEGPKNVIYRARLSGGLGTV